LPGARSSAIEESTSTTLGKDETLVIRIDQTSTETMVSQTSKETVLPEDLESSSQPLVFMEPDQNEEVQRELAE
jgi:hypothetical protein